MGTILSRVKLNKKHIISLLLFMLLASVAEMMLPTLLAGMIDNGIGGDSRAVIFTVAIVMAVMAFLACIANITATKLSAKISTKFAADIRHEIFYQVQSFSSAEMDKFGTASLVTRSTSAVTNVQMLLTMLLRLGVMAPLMAVSGLVLSSATGGKVSSVLNTAIPLLIISSGIIILFVSRYSVKMRQMIDRINKLFLETLEGVRVNGLLMPVIQVIFGVTTAAVMALGSIYVAQGEMEVGALVANSQYISMILASIILFAAVIMMFPMAYACAKEFVEKRDGTYHAEIAQGGTNLSGGQRQRMAIARAIMKKPEIYLFDDSFSALDMKTDKELRSNLKKNMGDATVIMVAQRVSSILDADRILVLEDGKIAGNGTHNELLKHCPLYREIAVLQLGEEAVSNEV